MKPKADRSAYFKKYREEHREELQLQKRDYYLAKRDQILATAARRGAPIRRVPSRRRYIIAEGRIYFNSKLGFSAGELRAALKELAEANRAAKS